MRSIIKSGLGCFSIALNIVLLLLFFGGCSGLARDEAAVFYLPPTPASGFNPPPFRLLRRPSRNRLSFRKSSQPPPHPAPTACVTSKI